ncbi:MAG: SlyX family protein, partial [Marinicella sp.]
MTIKNIESSTVSDEKFIDLETRIAFLEDTVDALNKLVYQQSKEIAQYEQALQNMTKHMKQVQSDIEEFKP